MGVTNGAARRSGRDLGEAQIGVNPGGIAVYGHDNIKGYVRSSPERQGNGGRPDILGGGSGGGEAGEEGSGGIDELHIEIWWYVGSIVQRLASGLLILPWSDVVKVMMVIWASLRVEGPLTLL